jgi:drug/metabolite transporter (DMT)-like permease
VFATVGAFFCYNYALSKLPAVRAAVFINGIPVVTALGAWLILGEKLTLLQVGGGALVLISVALANFPSGLRLPPHFKQTLLGSKAQ